jgi:hypothetical protein
MQFLRSLAAAAALLCASSVLAHETVSGPQKRAVEEFINAVATGSPQAIAYAIHPNDLESTRTRLMTALRAEAQRGESVMRVRLFGSGMPLAEIEKLTMITFYTTLSRRLHLPGRTYDDFRYAGMIPEGDDKAHVVVLARLERERGVPGVVQVVGVVTIKRYGRDWKAAMPSEVEAQIYEVMHGRTGGLAARSQTSEPPAGGEPPAGASADSGIPTGVRDRLAAAEKSLTDSKCDEYYKEHMSPNFRRVISKKALESLIAACQNSIGNREMLLSTLRIVRGIEPQFEYNARRLVYDVSGHGLPFDRFALELVKNEWFIAE